MENTSVWVSVHSAMNEWMNEWMVTETQIGFNDNDI